MISIHLAQSNIQSKRLWQTHHATLFFWKPIALCDLRVSTQAFQREMPVTWQLGCFLGFFSRSFFRQLCLLTPSPSLRGSSLSCSSINPHCTVTQTPPPPTVIVSLSARRNTSKRGETFGISRIGSKIKGVFKSTTMEGAMLPSSGLVEGEDDLVRMMCNLLEAEAVLFVTTWGRCCAKRVTQDEPQHNQRDWNSVPCILFSFVHVTTLEI